MSGLSLVYFPKVTPMSQSKTDAKLEVTLNIASGFLISLLVWQYLVAPLMSHGYLASTSWVSSLAITSIFTVTSWLRSYYWRRYFNLKAFYK